MKFRILLLSAVLTVLLGGTSLAQTDDTPPEPNTGFVATISDESLDEAAVDLDAETLYIRYHVCNLNDDADKSCADVLDEDFDPDAFEDWTEIAVEPNAAGEFNHGSFVSAFAREFDGGPGKGCLMRFIARSDWGKEGFDIASDDVLIQAETFCAFNRADGVEGDEVEGDDSDQRGGPPPWAGKGKHAAGDDDGNQRGGPPPWAGKPGGPKNTDD